MQALTMITLLALAVAALGGEPPLRNLAVPPAEAGSKYSTRLAEAARGTAAAWQVCGAALCRSGGDGSWYARQAQAGAGDRATPRMPAWKQAGVYGIEFTGAALGTAFAAAFGLATIEGVYQAGYNGPGAVPSSAVYFLTSALLSATGTHLMGKLVGRPNTFNRALVGGAAGGLAGGAAFMDFFATRRDPHNAMMPIAFVLPPLGAVLSYNLWRSDDQH